MIFRRRSVPRVRDADPVTPHCDRRVLHAPSQCSYCDEYPQWQQLRQLWGIAFTGCDPDLTAGEMSCPSDFRRGLNGAADWPGNQARRGPGR